MKKYYLYQSGVKENISSFYLNLHCIDLLKCIRYQVMSCQITIVVFLGSLWKNKISLKKYSSPDDWYSRML